jgi:Arc/MetJ-type ribon-helix-helix transcriptional regulator
VGIEITPEVESLINGIYAGGQYASQAEIIAAALQLLHDRDQLRRNLKRGCDELDRGERLDADEVFAELRQLLTM